MKRIRGDTYGGSQLKRPYGSSRAAEPYEQSQGVIGGGVGSSESLTTSGALSYLKEVKEIFQDQKDKYDMFLEVMKEFKAQRIDTAGVINRVKEIFRGHNNLILGFNTFLPRGYEITLDEDEAPKPKKAVEFEEAISFVNKIKRRFEDDERTYKAFLDILNMYRKELRDIDEVFNEVSNLLEDHPDLLEEFTRFLPDNSAHYGSYSQNSFQRYNERSSAAPTLRQMHSEKPRHRDRIISSRPERYFNVDRNEPCNDKGMMKAHKEQQRHFDRESRERKNREYDERGSQHDYHRDNKVSDRQKSEKRVGQYEANSFYNYGINLREKVKNKLDNDYDYQTLLEFLNMYNSGMIKKDDLEKKVADLLGKFPDLLKEFSVFVQCCEDTEGVLAEFLNKKSPFGDENILRPLKLDDKDQVQRREDEGAKGKDRYKEKYMGKSIQDLDLSNCQRCTPSYRLLPDDYPIPTASHRTELGAEVLNDHWVSVTSGSEDYSFKHMRKNQYEESLFRCEDDRYELDMLLESVSSTAARAEELLNSINGNRINKDALICIEDYFTALNLRCIERIYGDHGLEVIDILRKHPTAALPVILTRLEQKKEEWARCRKDFNKVWADVCKKNHYKSLDHRSFYFKQQDSKNLSTKSLVAEIRELKEKKQNEDDQIMGIAAGNRHPIVPHLEYEYFDIDVHEDLYKLVEFSCEEVCSPTEQFSKVMKLWTMFLEPMLGVASRLHSISSAEDVGNDGDSAVRSPRPDRGESSSRPNADASEMSCRDCEETCHEEVKVCTTASPNGNSVSYDGAHSGEQETKSTGAENSHGRPITEVASGSVPTPSHGSAVNEDNEDKNNGVLLATSEGNGASKSVLAAKGDLGPGTKVDRKHEVVASASEVEKEEGELSPNGHSEEDNFVLHGDVGAHTILNDTQAVESRMYHSYGGEDMCEDAGRLNGAEADDENSENASDAGEDASGSESAVDEGSREDREDVTEHDEEDGKAESEDEAEGLGNGQAIEQDRVSLSESLLLSVRPLAKHVPGYDISRQGKNSRVFYGNDDFYVLFRLHQILYERILSAKANTRAGDMKCEDPKDASSSDPYARFMSSLYDLLNGSGDNAKFEDECRTLIGNRSYVLFTLDKLIYKLVKQLQTVATDEMDNKLIQLYAYENSRKIGIADSVYYENARVLLHEENIYRFEWLSSPTRLSIQLMDNVSEKPEVFAVSIDPNFAAYLDHQFFSIPDKEEPRGIMLQRNKRKIAGLDEDSAFSTAMEGVQMVTGLECKMASSTYKISYVLDTEDFFYRPKKRRKNLPDDKSSLLDKSRVERFRKFLSKGKFLSKVLDAINE